MGILREDINLTTGRPSSVTPEVAWSICEQLADGRSLREILRQPGMPSMASVFRKLASDEAFREQYTQAKAFGIEAMVEDIQEIADHGSNDWMSRNDPDNPGYAYNGEAVARSRLRVDVRKWAASKVLAKKYGDSLNLGGEVAIGGLAAALKSLRNQPADDDTPAA